MMIDLRGRRAVVTGSTAGIGRAVAEGLARAGAAVVVNGRGQARVDAAVGELRRAFPDADVSGVAADLTTAEGAKTLFAQVPDADILVNNVGAAAFRGFADVSDDDWIDTLRVNVLTGIRATRHYLTGMTAKGWGRVVFVSSDAAVNIPPDMIDYGVSKTALLGVSRGVAESVAGTGVTVNAVLPGPTRSELVSGYLQQQVEEHGITVGEAERRFIQAARPTSLIGRIADTDEVANVIVFACSEQASAITGAALRVDGGVVRFVA